MADGEPHCLTGVPLGHTPFSWASQGATVPVGHTPFSWTGSGTATPKPPEAKKEFLEKYGERLEETKEDVIPMIAAKSRSELTLQDNNASDDQDEDAPSARNGSGTRLGDSASAAVPDVPADTAAAEPETAQRGDGGKDTCYFAPEVRTTWPYTTKVMALHHNGKTVAQIRNHYQLVDYGLTEATVLEIIREARRKPEEAKAEAATAARASTGLGAGELGTGSTREQITAPKTYTLPELKEWMGCFSKGGDPDRMRELLAHTFSNVLLLLMLHSKCARALTFRVCDRHCTPRSWTPPMRALAMPRCTGRQHRTGKISEKSGPWPDFIF